MKQTRQILLNPGPVTLTDRVRKAMTRYEWCHREPEFAELTQQIIDRLLHVYPEATDAYGAVLLSGSGTAAVETMLASFAPRQTKTLVITNGVYGERMLDMLRVQDKPYIAVEHDWLAALDLHRVESALDASVSHVAAVHHETTSGRLNDIASLGRLCVERDKLLLLDAVSSFGAEQIGFEDWGLDAVAATANKCLHGAPGVSLVIARKSSLNDRSHSASVYLDAQRYYRSQSANGYSPFTQAIPAALTLAEALAELEDEGGWKARQEVYRERAGAISDALESAGVSSLLTVEDNSCVLRSWIVPDNQTYHRIHDDLKQAGFIIYAGQGRFSDEVFRIAHMGDIGQEDLDRLCSELRRTFRSGES